MKIVFANCTDAGCPIEPEEMERYVQEVESALAEMFPDAEIESYDTIAQTKVTVDGDRRHDLEDLAQSVWEAGAFW